jgi:hypothetical protein
MKAAEVIRAESNSFLTLTAFLQTQLAGRVNNFVRETGYGVSMKKCLQMWHIHLQPPRVQTS